jgi:hypothetical protein
MAQRKPLTEEDLRRYRDMVPERLTDCSEAEHPLREAIAVLYDEVLSLRAIIAANRPPENADVRK